MANVTTERSKNGERFLSQLTSKQSQGLPVGPFSSIILAEACLIDVDNFLLRLKLSYTRYVDDFRIFCSSRKHAIEVRHGLSDYLFAVHRLSLESSKSYVQYLENFVREQLFDPEEREEQAKFEKLTELLVAAKEERGGYWDQEIEEPSDEVLGQAEQESFIELFKKCVENSPLNLGLARHLLRKAKRNRTVVLNNLVFKHLEALAPVMREPPLREDVDTRSTNPAT